jgi:isoquinoline 1-oxidoreductase beta subunit
VAIIAPTRQRAANRHPLEGQPKQLEPRPVRRRRFLGYLIAAPTLAAVAPLGVEFFRDRAGAAIPSPPELSDEYDLSDLLTDATKPTANLIAVVVNRDNTVSFALPRAEVGQGITTAVAMTIADEMDPDLEQVVVTLADARPELVWNQSTGGSNSMHSLFTPVRVAAATAPGAGRAEVLRRAHRSSGSSTTWPSAATASPAR